MRLRSLLILVIMLLVAAPLTIAQEDGDLAGTEWQLASLGGDALVEGTTITLAFAEDGSAGGTSGCNQYGGSYTVTGSGEITFSDVFSTMMACMADGVMEQESAYTAALQAATAYAITDGQLVITYGSGDTLVFDPAPELFGTQWRLVSIDDAELVEGTEITLGFDVQGNVVGSAGCNQYGGTSVITDETVTFDGLYSTEMACTDEDLMAQETAYTTALAAATAYTIDGDTLTITAGETTLVFERLNELAGTGWLLESLTGAEVTNEVTLLFDNIGGAAGSGACNQYSTTYTLNDDEIRFGAIVSTRMACPEDVMMLEQAYFAALETAESFSRTPERLTITTENGDTLVFISLAATSSSAAS